MFWVNYLNVIRVFKCNKLAVYFKLTLGMTFVVLYKYLNCAADEILTQVALLLLTVAMNYRIVLLTMLFITSWYKPFKTDPFREIFTYAT